MPGLPQDWWKLAVVVAVAVAIVAIARAARAAAASWLIGAALTFYAIGATVWLTDHVLIACGLYLAGIACATGAVWRSRGREPDDPHGRDKWDGVQPPDGPEGRLRIDWEAFERDLRAYEASQRQAASPR